MRSERLFLDTAFIQALFNKRDSYHSSASQLLPRVRIAAEVWLTEAILIEVGNALSAVNRTAVISFIQKCYTTPNMRVVSIDTEILNRALQLYQARPDKTWGLTDCISFVVMQDQGLIDAVTTDRHFIQAGFRALMLNN